MPFKSMKQERYMFATHPKIAAKWQNESPLKAPKEHLDLKGVIKGPKSLSAWAKIPNKGGT